jgi:FlaA1/EpsC-like NDP-sugar epimerase
MLVAATRYEFNLSGVYWSSILSYAVMACFGQLLIGAVFMLYRGRYRTASFDEAMGLGVTALSVAGILALVFLGLVGTDSFPRATAILTPAVALMLMGGGRWAYRAWTTRRLFGREGAERVLIYGAGEAGYQLIRSIYGDSAGTYEVVGLIDDARSKRHLRLHGVPVVGTRHDILRLAEERGVSTVILAITTADATLVSELSSVIEGGGLKLLILPSVCDLGGARVTVEDIRELDIADILGRHQIETDLGEIAGYLTGRCVLVTGAGGSIGSELARQVYRFGPRELVLLDRDESALHAVQLSIYGKGLLDTPDMVLADIRDEAALDKIFADHRPEVVLHAAALKHLPMLEQYPEEGWKTNVLGSLNVLRAAGRYGCARFVNISTDKAASPTSVLGRTKRVAERLTAWHGMRGQGIYLSVRFGNVLGSRGSMLHTFTTQIKAGGPVTVTHPDVTRFFMTIPEACQLTIQAAAIGKPGEVLVLDMGEPVRILDVARRLVARAHADIDIIFTGLRPGEKMHEVLFSATERGESREHPLISHVPVPPLNPACLSDVKSDAIHGVDHLCQAEVIPLGDRAHLSVLSGHRTG